MRRGTKLFPCPLAILSASALDAVAWLNKKRASFPNLDGLLFLAAEAVLLEEHLTWLRKNLCGRPFRLLFPNDLPGCVADLKVAAALRGFPVAVAVLPEEKIMVTIRSKTFLFSQENFSLSAFEKASGYRFGIPAEKPRLYNSFLTSFVRMPGCKFYWMNTTDPEF